jgi:ABC-type uncharacterized transport system permease subunit
MNSGSLLFYALASFLLGIIAIAVGGGRALALVLQPFGGGLGSDAEPVLAWLTLIAPFVFLVLAVIVSRRETREDRK